MDIPTTPWSYAMYIYVNKLLSYYLAYSNILQMETENLFYQAHFGFCQIVRQGAGGLFGWVGVNPVLRIVNINTNLFSMTFS